MLVYEGIQMFLRVKTVLIEFGPDAETQICDGTSVFVNVDVGCHAILDLSDVMGEVDGSKSDIPEHHEVAVIFLVNFWG